MFLVLGLGSVPAAAQDVIVFPSSTDASAPMPLIFSTHEVAAAAPEAPPPDANAPSAAPAPVQMAREPATAGSPIPEQPIKQCITDADCIISNGGCQTIEAVNKNYDATWRARLARNLPTCAPLPDLAMQQALQSVKPVCRANICGLQSVKLGK